jgi:hypothetical protein
LYSISATFYPSSPPSPSNSSSSSSSISASLALVPLYSSTIPSKRLHSISPNTTPRPSKRQIRQLGAQLEAFSMANTSATAADRPAAAASQLIKFLKPLDTEKFDSTDVPRWLRHLIYDFQEQGRRPTPFEFVRAVDRLVPADVTNYLLQDSHIKAVFDQPSLATAADVDVISNLLKAKYPKIIKPSVPEVSYTSLVQAKTEPLYKYYQRTLQFL